MLDALPPALRRQRLLGLLCRLRLVQAEQLLEFDAGGQAWVDLRARDCRAVYLSRSFWPEFHQMVAAFLRGGGDLFDVGANFGLVTFGVLPLVAGAGGAFHLFEANRRIVPLLSRSARLWPEATIHVNHCCVTDRRGTSRLVLPGTSWSKAFIGDAGEPVPNLVLDDYIAERRIPRIAFMKMDVEGWEPHALRGGRRALAAGKVHAAFVEVAPSLLRRNSFTADGLLAMLEELGFDIYFCGLWDEQRPHGPGWVRVAVNGTALRFAPAAPLPPAFVQGDVMCIHRSTRLAAELTGALGRR